MPLGVGRSRLLFRTVNKGFPWFVTMILKSKPMWSRHLNSCKVLEQDVGLITTQEDIQIGSGDSVPLKVRMYLYTRMFNVCICTCMYMYVYVYVFMYVYAYVCVELVHRHMNSLTAEVVERVCPLPVYLSCLVWCQSPFLHF
jgi:hypothetical protein